MRPWLTCLLLISSYIGFAEAQQPTKCVAGRPDCCDRHQFCVFWAQRNECNINPRWMKKNCQVSCNVCSGSRDDPSTTSSSPSTITTTTMGPLPVPRPSNSSQSGIPAGCSSISAVQVETRQVFGADALTKRFNQIGCAEVQIGPDCSVNMCYHKKYRSLDGTCNNMRNTILGASFTPFTRMLSAAYDDGFNALVATIRRNRPNAREISMFLLSSSRALDSHANSMLMQFAQFVSHDVTKNSLINTCNCQSAGPQCGNVIVPAADRGGRQCIPFTRSTPVCGTGVPNRIREQLNLNTAFIDGSLIYASESVTLRALRVGSMLRTQVINGRIFPPGNGRNSMSVGDDRAPLFVGLAALHTTFLRLHNNIAARLQNMNPHWNQDRVFQETRKIVGAIIQVIVYQEFLPTLIGPFHSRLVPRYGGYQANVNPSVITEFSTAAYRLHGMIQESYPLLDSNFRESGNTPFLRGVNNFAQIMGDIDAIYRGLIATPARNPQRITTSVTERLFDGMGDMATFNIQRGRDHGLRPYNDYRKLCNLRPVTNFTDWPEVTNPSVRQRVAQLYSNNPENLDLYVGGILEEPIDGSMVGPTFACIIAEQFVRLRDGDRFYFENPEAFTSAQLAALKKTSLSWVLCDTGDSMTRIVPKAFTTDRGNQAVSCASITQLDLTPWTD
ncbi:unnamed protein product [Auanema sp. JU1783]|nr:unnamed protein product [Auanema sp. JU1783]